MADTGPKITLYAKGAESWASGIATFVKSGIKICLWVVIGGAASAAGYLGIRCIWWGVQRVLEALGI